MLILLLFSYCLFFSYSSSFFLFIWLHFYLQNYFEIVCKCDVCGALNGFCRRIGKQEKNSHKTMLIQLFIFLFKNPQIKLYDYYFYILYSSVCRHFVARTLTQHTYTRKSMMVINLHVLSYTKLSASSSFLSFACYSLRLHCQHCRPKML